MIGFRPCRSSLLAFDECPARFLSDGAFFEGQTRAATQSGKGW